MKMISKLLLSMMIIGSLSYISCKKDDNPSGCNYVTETQDELNAVNEAAAAYGADPNNPVKCQAFKDAYQAYLNDLENHIDCATVNGQQAELQSAIDSAQASLDQIQC